jgi:hypothetical protein
MVYNSLVGLRQRVRQAWSQVDIQLKRRYELIPNLVKVVQGYSMHEQETQALMATLRSQAETPADSANHPVTGLTSTLRVAIEHYPDLKSSELFLKLQKELAETEQRIALARDYFNNIATFYNGRMEIVPDRFVAAVTGFKPQTLICATDLERAPVRVNLVS